MFFWKRRNDLEIAKLLKSILIRLDDLDRKVTTMANVSNAKLDQIKETLITAGAGVNTLIANNQNFAAALEEARSNGVDVSKLDEVFQVSTGIATAVAAALNPTVATPPVSELPVVQPAPTSPDLGVTPVPTTEDPIADLPSEAPTAEAPVDSLPSDPEPSTPATETPADSSAAAPVDVPADSSAAADSSSTGSTDTTTS